MDKWTIPDTPDTLTRADAFRLGSNPSDAEVERANIVIQDLSVALGKARAEAEAMVAAALREAAASQAIDDMAYWFWSVHPREIAADGYEHIDRGGKYKNPRAAWYADKMRNLLRALIPPAGQSALDSVVAAETSDLRAEIAFLKAQIEAWESMAPPPKPDLLRKRPEERTAIRAQGDA